MVGQRRFPWPSRRDLLWCGDAWIFSGDGKKPSEKSLRVVLLPRVEVPEGDKRQVRIDRVSDRAFAKGFQAPDPEFWAFFPLYLLLRSGYATM